MLALLSADYGLFLYGYINAWRQNPHCSFSCCLALLLPLNDLQGDIGNLASTNVLKTQLDTGEFEMVALQDAIKDSGAIDVTLGEDKESDDGGGDRVEMKDDSRQGVKYSGKKCEQETQTELLSLFTVTTVNVHESINEAHF